MDSIDNVFIFGAGVSCGAGIPLLSGFVEKMWKIAYSGKVGESSVSDGTLKNLREAIDIRSELDNYHGRVAFNDRNLEDILSLLSFNRLVGSGGDLKINVFKTAIRDTIELLCAVKHDGRLNYSQESGDDIYRLFWKHLIEWCKGNGKASPVIISFNYDLVLERALVQSVVGPDDRACSVSGLFGTRLPFSGIELDYSYGGVVTSKYVAKRTVWRDAQYGGGAPNGTSLEKGVAGDWESCLFRVPYYKLHGSLNFSDLGNDKEPIDILKVVDSPYLLPPVYSKQHNSDSELMWSRSLSALRSAA